MAEFLWSAYQATHLDVQLPDEGVRQLEQVESIAGDEWPFDVGCAWIITAFNPRSIPLSTDENRVRHEALGRDLEKSGIAHLPNRGFDSAEPTWWEDGYTLPGADTDVVLGLARKWEQNAVFAWYPDKWRIVGVLFGGERTHGWKWRV